MPGAGWPASMSHCIHTCFVFTKPLGCVGGWPAAVLLETDRSGTRPQAPRPPGHQKAVSTGALNAQESAWFPRTSGHLLRCAQLGGAPRSGRPLDVAPRPTGEVGPCTSDVPRERPLHLSELPGGPSGCRLQLQPPMPCCHAAKMPTVHRGTITALVIITVTRRKTRAVKVRLLHEDQCTHLPANQLSRLLMGKVGGGRQGLPGRPG